MRHVTALVFACLFLFLIVTVELVIPYWNRIQSSGPVAEIALALFYLVPSAWAGTRFYFTLRDIRDERYEITDDGWLITTYQTWGEYHEPRRHRISDILGGKFVRSGRLQYFLNFGDVILYGRWYGDPFILRDVYKPARVYALIMHTKRREFGQENIESALAQGNANA